MSVNQYLPGVIQIPSALTITAITQSFPMVITISVNPVTEANTYQSGQVVRLNIPRTYGMMQADGLQAQILGVNGSNISLAIDSTHFDPFAVPGPNQEQPATLAPSGSRNLQYNNTTTRVPFQSFNNRGN